MHCVQKLVVTVGDNYKNTKQQEKSYPNFMSDNCKLIFGDCLKEMKSIEEHSIDLIASDLPYGVTNNRWDSVINLEDMWAAFERVTTDSGVVVLTATQPFATNLIVSNRNYCKKIKFKYDLIWEKTISSGQLNVRQQPMRNHEHILIFSKPKPVYNEQKTKGEPYKITRKLKKYSGSYGEQVDGVHKENDGDRHAKSVIRVSNPRIRAGHPTQKPEPLMAHIIKTYSNEGAMVLDCCMGSGTTGVSAIKENRRFTGIENDEGYFEMAKERINKLLEAL